MTIIKVKDSLKSIVVLFLVMQHGCSGTKNLQVNRLQANYMRSPEGFEKNPQLSWNFMSVAESQIQSAYQVIVASDLNKLTENKADLWNTGKVVSSQNMHVKYAGKALNSGQKVYWKVKVWDQQGKTLGYSAPGSWKMDLIEDTEWKSKWISAVKETDSVPPVLPSPYFRKEFEVDAGVADAILYISGVGYFEAFLNGEKIGNHVLDPVLTRYDKRVKYVTHDLTDKIKAGANAIGVVLGNGWYNHHTRSAWDFDKAPWRESPALNCQLIIRGKDGTQKVIVSDTSWRFEIGPIVFNGVSNGETYDARKELGDWAKAGFDVSNWKVPVLVKGPEGKLSPQLMPPIRVISSIAPTLSWKINDTITMYDLGQNITGWSNIKVKGPAGQMVKVRYGERIFEDSTLDQKELSRFIWTGDTQTDRYILKGEGVEQWHPVFTYHGFQFMEVTTQPGIEVLDIKGDVVHTDLQQRGYFRSSNEMFNQLQKNIGWSFKGNYHGYPTDCPHREKMGWTGDALLVAETGLFNYDMVQSYLKWIDDFVDEQQENGQLPGIVPTSGWGYSNGKVEETRPRGYGPQWEGAFMEIPWQVFRYTGDTSILKTYYPYFKKYVDYLEAHSKGNLLNFGIDDHKQLVNLTDGAYLSSAFYFYLSNMLSKMAGITGATTDVEKYTSLAKNIKYAFNKKYYNTNTGLYDHGGQTPMALALFFGLPDDQNEQRVLNNLLEAIKKKNGHIDAGVVGTKAVINVLMQYGQEKVLYEMADKRTFPGWGYWVDSLKATTMFQNWDGSQSRNHIMFGSIGDYFFKGIGGINIDDSQPGFKHLIIRPSFNNDLTWAEVGYQSSFGEIKSHWKKDTNGLQITVTIPANSTAQIHLPFVDSGQVKINGKAVEPSTLRANNDKKGKSLIFNAGSGNYEVNISGYKL